MLDHSLYTIHVAQDEHRVVLNLLFRSRETRNDVDSLPGGKVSLRLCL